MLSPTTTPAPSPGNSQRSSKSFRLTDVTASMPRRMPPAWLNGGETVTAKVTGFVTPCIVKSPVTEYEVALDLLTLVETKMMAGYLATSKKSGLLRCVSRSSTPVVIMLTSMAALILELAGVVSSSMTVPEGCGNRPRTLLSTCLQTNSAEEFSGSSSHFEIFGTAGTGTEGVSTPTDSSVITASANGRIKPPQPLKAEIEYPLTQHPQEFSRSVASPLGRRLPRSRPARDHAWCSPGPVARPCQDTGRRRTPQTPRTMPRCKSVRTQ